MSSPEVLESSLFQIDLSPIGKLWGRSGWSFSMFGGAVVIHSCNFHHRPIGISVLGSACLSINLATCKDLKPNPFGNPFERILKGHGVRYHVFRLDQHCSAILLRRPNAWCPVSSFGKSLTVMSFFKKWSNVVNLLIIARPTPLHESSDQAASHELLSTPVPQWPPVQLSRREELAGLVPGCFIQQATFHVESTIFFGFADSRPWWL